MLSGTVQFHRGTSGGILKKISIFIPAYNASKHVESVIQRIPGHVWKDIISVWIINDGSTDSTKQVVEKCIKNNKKIKLIHFNQNQGYGNAVKTGCTSCKNDRCDIAVCLHADGQYPPEEIPRFVDTMIDRKFDILQGSRIASGTALSGGMPFYKLVANNCLSFFENVVFRMHMTDYHSGFMFYSSRALDTIKFTKLSGSFDIDLEMIASARSRGLSIGQLPIPTRYADEVSYLNPITYGLRVVWVMIKYLLGRYKQ